MKDFSSLEDLRKHTVLNNFLDICEIPHGSFNEKELSDYIKNWALERGLEVEQDDYHNLMIKKEGQLDGVGKEPLLLQAHLDMVCEKDPDYEFDFLTDPIPVKLNGDELWTENKTTLGADNGLGVAAIMSLMDEKNISHPPLIGILTSAEEDDFSGAANLNPDWIGADRGINLDNSNEKSITVGSNGGSGAEIEIDIEREARKTKLTKKVEVSGLRGGHSGADINKGHGNAIIIIGRLLEEIKSNLEVELLEFNGGNFRLAIPREANLVLGINEEDEEKLSEIVKDFHETLSSEYIEIKNEMSLEITDTNSEFTRIKDEYIDKITGLIKLAPNGVMEINAKTLIVESSCNLGEVHNKEDKIELVLEIRALHESQVDYIYSKIELIGKMFDVKTNAFAKYPGWTYDPDSDLREEVQGIYKRIRGEEQIVRVSPGGLECGYLIEKNPKLDIIAIGPKHRRMHSPYESANVPSIMEFYEILKEILKSIE